jgi:hypothetical protein
MAICAVIDGSTGFLAATATAVDSCTGYVVQDASEYGAALTLGQIFTVPVVDDLQMVFSTGFTIPLIIYLVAWGYQSVINFATTDKEV